jgi:hypothetical protein
VRNDTFLYPQDGWGWRTDQFYELITTTGQNIQDPDSVVDRTVVMTSGMVPAGGPDDTTFTTEYILIEAAVQGDLGIGLQELQAHMDDARGELIPQLNELGLFSEDWRPYVCGDANGDGVVNSGDIVFLINYLYLGTSPPHPYEAGDANGDTRVDIADIMAIANYYFLGESIYCYGDRPCGDLGERDTLLIKGVWGSAGDTVDVPISIFNDDSIFFNLSLLIPDPSKAIFLDTVITDSVRLEPMDLSCVLHDTTGIRICWFPDTTYDSTDLLVPGYGIVAYLRCVLKQDISPGSALCIDTTFFSPGHWTRFYTRDTYCIIPEFKCVAQRGDVTGDGVINVADVLYLINYLFLGASAPDPLYMGDVTYDGVVNTADVIRLINYLFLGASPPSGG